MSREVIALKLSSGEEIIARVEKIDENTFVVSSPNLIGLVPGPEGVSIQLMPWIASNQDVEAVTIQKQHIVASCKANPQLEERFLEKTSGIALG